MKRLYICLFLFALPLMAQATTGFKFVTNVDADVTFDASGNCSVSGFTMNTENTAEASKQFCMLVGGYNKASVTQITAGSYAGAYRHASEVSDSSCTVSGSGTSKKAACGTAVVGCASSSPPTC